MYCVLPPPSRTLLPAEGPENGAAGMAGVAK